MLVVHLLSPSARLCSLADDLCWRHAANRLGLEKRYIPPLGDPVSHRSETSCPVCRHPLGEGLAFAEGEEWLCDFCGALIKGALDGTLRPTNLWPPTCSRCGRRLAYQVRDIADALALFACDEHADERAWFNRSTWEFER